MRLVGGRIVLFFFKAPPTTEIYTLSLHDALPISMRATAPAPTRKAQPLPRNVARYSPGGSLSAPKKPPGDRKSTRLNSSHSSISYAVFCLKKKKPLTTTVMSLDI